MTKVIEFIKPYAPYAVGDVAGLPEKEAQAAIDAEVAVPYGKEKEEKTEEVKKEDTAEKKSVDAPRENKQIENPVVKK